MMMMMLLLLMMIASYYVIESILNFVTPFYNQLVL